MDVCVKTESANDSVLPSCNLVDINVVKYLDLACCTESLENDNNAEEQTTSGTEYDVKISSEWLTSDIKVESLASEELEIQTEVTYDTVIKHEPLEELHIKEETGRNATEVNKHFECKFCGETFLEKRRLLRHLVIHWNKEPLKCKICPYKTFQKGNLRQHKKIHTGERSFVCEICQYRGIHKGHLNQHMKIHSGERPFMCGICQYKSTRSDTLKEHMKVHSGEKPFACEMCEYKTNKKNQLKEHMKMHTGEKPFVCGICEYKAIRKSNLSQHMKSAHIGEKLFACEICEYKAVWRYRLNRHMKTHKDKNHLSAQCADVKLLGNGKIS